MTTREEFKRAVIEAIHGKPYDDDIAILECEACDTDGYLGDHKCKHKIGELEITLGRVMQALGKEYAYSNLLGLLKFGERRDVTANYPYIRTGIYWKLTEDDGQECTDDDQTDGTIEELYKLIK